MHFALTEEQQMYRRVARDFAERELAPQAAAVEERGEFPWENVRKLAEGDYFAMALAPQYGGLGLGALTSVIVLEEICRCCCNTGAILQGTMVCAHLLEKYGSDFVREKYLVPVAKGQAVAAFAATEPQSGSDIMSHTTTAAKDGQDYVINGRKAFIGNALEAAFVVVLARTESEGGRASFSWIAVDRDAPGFSVGRREQTMGLRALSVAEVSFKNVRVPQANLVGRQGEGLDIISSGLHWGNIFLMTEPIGVCQAALEASIQFARQRRSFGVPIAQHQAIQFMVSDMATELEMCRLLAYKAAWLCDQGLPYDRYATMLKIATPDMALRLTNMAIQIHGAAGYCRDFPVERYMRQIRLYSIGEGTSEMHRQSLARLVFRDGV
ncbi:MAG TPA: acyl-CoA dehydrogenase family protein [Dehalococcoidia bacterium]|nr:acyl-CoA dehydrogenase family protein [Dehalococcoidia bacterium]